MFCPDCGTGNPDDSSHCAQCGQALTAELSPQAGIADVDYYEAAIGPSNTDYYLRRFERFARGEGLASWHWPAFFVTLPWLLYRKMWGYAVAYFFVPTVIYFVLALVLAAIIGEFGFLVAWLLQVALIFIAVPVFANAAYFRVVSKRIGQARLYGTDPARQLRSLAAAGGTSSLALIIVLVAMFLVIPVIGILAAIAIPAYQDYTIRAQVSEGLSLAASSRAAVAETWLNRNRAPTDRQSAGLSPAATDTRSAYVSSVDVRDGEVIIEYGNDAHANIHGGTLALTPFLAGNGAVVWVCGRAAVPADFTPIGAARMPTTLPAIYLPSACRP